MNDHIKPTVSVSLSFRSLALVSALLLAASSTANAATDTWSGSVNGIWDISTLNWNSGATAFTSANDALFTGTPANNVTNAAGLTIGAITFDNTFTGGVTLTGNNTVNSTTTISAGTLSIKHGGTATGAVSGGELGASAITLNSPGLLYVDDDGNGTTGAERILTIANNVSGAGTLQARPSALHTSGWSSVNLSANLSGFTGTLNVLSGSTANRGKVKFTAASQATLLSSSATVSIQNSGQLYLNQGYNYGFAIQLNGGTGPEGFGSLRLDNAGANVTGSVTLQADSVIAATANGTISGAIGQSGGTYGFTKLGGSTLTLSGPSTYAGKTLIASGTLTANSVNSVSGGSATSALGHPTTAANGTIDMGSGTTGITFNYNGTGETSDRILNLAGTTGGATLNNNGTGPLKFTSNITATGLGNKTVTLGGSTGDGEISGSLTNSTGFSTSLIKNGTNTWTLSAATNYFTGQLQVNGGTLVWNSAAALAPSSANFLPLNITAGGRLVVNGPLRYSSGSAGVNGYVNLGNNAVGGIGTILINSGGSLTCTNQTGNPNSIVGQQGTGGVSTLMVNGGSFSWDGSGGLIFGNSGGSGTLVVSNNGTATILAGSPTSTDGRFYVALGRDSATSTGVVQLVSGTLTTDRVFMRDTSSGAGSGVALFNFDGGTLKALKDQTDWLLSADSGNNLALTAVTVMDGGAKIDANGFNVAINSSLAHGGVAATDGGLKKLGTGTLTLGGASAYNGATVVSNGTLRVTGSLDAASAVTVAGGSLVNLGSIGGTVTMNAGTTLLPSSGSFGGLVTLNSGNAAINLQDTTTSTITFGSGLTLNNGNVLSFELGSSSDQITVSGGTYTHNGTTTINLAAISGISATTYTLIQDSAFSIASTNGYVLGTVPAGYLATLNTSGGTLVVTLTQNAPSAAFWKGDVDNKWSTISGGNNSNWATDSTGATDIGAAPSTPTAVTFAATGAANLNTVLGADFTINDLTLSTANNVTIGGTTNTLTLVNGLLNDTTALNNTISVSNVVLGGSQTWQNNSANPLTVSSRISGSPALTIGGTGSIVLTSTNSSHAGGTLINSGTLQLGDGTANNGLVSGNITNSSALVFANPSALVFSGQIDGIGTVAKSASGTLTLSHAANSYSGNLTVAQGQLTAITPGTAVGTVAAGVFGTSPSIAVSNGAALFIDDAGNGTTASRDLVVSSALVGGGTVQIRGANTHDWDTVVLNGDLSGFTSTIQVLTNANLRGKLRLGATSPAASATIAVASGTALYLNLAVDYANAVQLYGAGNIENMGALRMEVGATVSGPITIFGNTSIGANTGTQIINGVISESGGSYGFTKLLGGTLSLGGANTHSGTTTMSAGTLSLANGAALHNSTLDLAAGALVFDGAVSSNAFVFGGLSGSVSFSLANTFSSPITLSVGNNNSSTTYSGVLSDSGLGGSLTKIGNGTLTLSGANSYSGTTTVAAGKLAINTLQTNATAGIVVNNGATLSVSAVNTNQLAPASYTLGGGTVATNEFSGLSSTTIAPVNTGTLTVNGSVRVNIASGTFATGNSYPLISYTSIGGTGGFVLGTLPRGLTASIVTNGGNTIALNVTAYTPATDVWTGAANTNWDIGTTTNWLVSGSPDTFLNGDIARFDDTATETNVFVTTLVEPLNTVVSNATKTFAFTGSSIGGSGSLTKQGAGTLVLGQANTYSGNTVISNGTLKVANANAIPSGTGKGDVVVAATLDLNTNSITINGLSGSGTVDTVAGGSPTLTVGASGGSATFAGVLKNTAGTLALTKTGNGTLTLSGTNAYTGNTVVSLGTVNYFGQLGITPAVAAGQLIVNNTGMNAIFSVSAPANIQFNNNNPLIGNNAAGAGAFYQSGGTVSGINQFQMGAVTGGAYGYYKLSGGSMTMAEMDLAGFNGAAVGVCDITGGDLNITSWFVPARGNAALGMLNMTGGTLNFSGPAGQFQANWQGGVGTAVINLANASLLAPGANVSMIQQGVAGKLGEINLLAGGLLQANSIAPNSATGNSVLNFNGGTLKASAATATFITANNTAVNVYANGGTIDNNGVNITIPKELVAPAGDGINGAVTVDNGGSGYIGAPAVTFSGDGVGAAGYAVISGGSVTSIVMTSPGYGYTFAPTVTLTGGGGSGASATAPSPTPNTSGGMKFIGTGVTTLSAANTYTGTTVVSNGTLLVNGSLAGAATVASGATLGGTGTVGGSLAVNSGASLAPGSGAFGTLTVNGDITLNAGSTNTFEVDGTTPANDTVAAGANVTYGGVLKIAPTGAFTAGQTFTLFSGAGASSASNFASIEGSPGSGLTFSFTNGVLSVVGGVATNPTNITFSASGGNLTLSWPTDHTGWTLQVQTNSRAVGLSTNWFPVSGSATTNQVTIPVSPVNGTVFYRLVYP